jgi:hypothetical protein
MSGKFSSRLFLSAIVVVLLACVLALAIPSSAAANGEVCTKTIYVRQETLAQQGTNGDIVLWHFIINGIDDSLGPKPTSIHVYWDNGFDAVVPLVQGQGGEVVAHYNADQNTGNVVTEATAVIYCAWDGQFNLSHVDRMVPPVPELPTVLLLGVGLVGVAGVLGVGLVKRRIVAGQ